MRIDADGIEIEQFAIADFGGAALAVKGRIDTRAQSPRGALTLDLDARALDGVLALVEKFAPQAAEQLRQLGRPRSRPLALRASLALDPGRGWKRGSRTRSSRSTAAPARSASRCTATRAWPAMRSRSTTSPPGSPPPR